jgi:transposase
MVQGYRIPGDKNSKTKTIESFGYLDELTDKYDDPIAYLEKYVDDKNKEQADDDAEYTIIAKKNQKLKKGTLNRKNYGYIIILKLFHELGIDRFLINRQQKTKIEFNTSSIMKLLIIQRILAPGSKKKAFDTRERYFDFEKNDAFTLTDVYRSLTHFNTLKDDLQLHLHKRISKQYGRDMEMIYYDVTNYYFESDIVDGLKAKGPSKEGRKDPIVQMGLSMDADGLPISYDVFPGNESEKLHLRPMVTSLLSKYETGKIIAVADAGQNTGNNIYFLDQGKQGYVFSQSIRGGSASFKKYVTSEEGYVWHGDEHKRKSRLVRREISVDFIKPGKTYEKKVLVDQRQIVFYSEKYATRSKAKRELALLKAKQIVDNPSAYTKATSYGALKYVKNIEVDTETGELKASHKIPYLDLSVLMEEEKYDGYYCIVTNVFDEGKNKGRFSDEKIIETYRGLWQIEDSFRVTKSDLCTRPIHVSIHDHIHAHFLTCFISLVILRLIQKNTGYRHSPEKLIEAMNKISCSNESENLYLFDYASDISEELGDAFGIDFSRMRLTRKEIKKNLGDVKKS